LRIMRSREEFARRIAADIAAGKIGGTLMLLSGGPGWGKTSLLQRLERELSKKKKLRAVLFPFEEICFSPDFYLEKAEGLLVGTTFLTDLNRSATSSSNISHPTVVESFFSLVEKIESDTNSELILLIDEAAELAVLKSYPNQGDPLPDFLERCRGRKTVLASAFPSKVIRAAARVGMDLQEIEIPPLSVPDLLDFAADLEVNLSDEEAKSLSCACFSSPAYARSLLEYMGTGKSADVKKALSIQMQIGGGLELLCRFHYEFLVQRSRGQGIVRQLLAVLSRFDLEGKRARLSELAAALGRSLGVTKDYLKWLLDVSLIECSDKRYWIRDRLLASWIRLYRSGTVVGRIEFEREMDGILGAQVHATSALEAETLKKPGERKQRHLKPESEATKGRTETVMERVPDEEKQVQYVIHKPKPSGLVGLD
jgi:hypothetical protein